MTQEYVQGKYVLGSRNDPGDARRNNEDRIWVDEIQRREGDPLIAGILADGVGSAEGAAGAQMAIDSAKKSIRESGGNNIPQILMDAIEFANVTVYKENQKIDGNGLTTLVVAIIYKDRCFIGNVGDSRAYWIQGTGKGKILQLTRDHSYYNIYGGVDPNSQEGGVLVNYIGKKPEVFVDMGFYLKGDDPEQAHQLGVNGLPLKPGDSILLCSDGLIKTDRLGKRYADDLEIANALMTESETDKAAIKMVSAAVGRRPDDNVSAVTLQYLSDTVIKDIMANKKREKTTKFVRQSMPVIGVLAALAVVFALIAAINRYANPPIQILPTYTPYPTLVSSNSMFVNGLGGSIGRIGSSDGKSQDLTNGIYTISQNSRVEISQNGASIILADGSGLYMSSDTTFVFIKIENGTELFLEQGAIMAKLGVGTIPLSIKTRDGFIAQVSGSVMGIQNSLEPLGTYVDCYEGHCMISGGVISQLNLDGENRYLFYAAGNANPSDQVQRCEFWKEAIGNETIQGLGYCIQQLLPTPTDTPKPAGGNLPQATPNK